MAHYKKGEDTRNLIINEARSMFKKSGFDKVMLADLYRNNNIKCGTMTYYFSSKLDLALYFYKEYISACVAKLRADTDIQDLLFINITLIYVMNLHIFSEESNVRFHMEVISKESAGRFLGEELLSLLEDDLNNRALFKSLAIIGVRREYSFAMFNLYKKDKLSDDDIIKFNRESALIILKIYGCSDAEINDIIAFAEKYVTQFGYSSISLL